MNLPVEQGQRLKYLFRALAVGLMLGCLALSVVSLVGLFLPDWNGAYLVVGCVLAALEASYSYRLIQDGDLHGAEELRFRAVEIVMFLILLKVVRYVGRGWDYLLADVQTWPHDVRNLLDIETVAAFILVVLSWWTVTQTINDLERLGEPPERDRHYAPPRQSLARRYVWGGGLLLILAGLSRVGIAQLLNLERPPVPGLVLNVLVYFLLGLVLMGQVQFDVLRAQWRSRGIKVAGRLADRWVRYSLVLIGLAALIALVLPTGYTLGLLGLVGGALTLVGSVLWLILGLLIVIISLPLLLVLYLFFLLTGVRLSLPRLPLRWPPPAQGAVGPAGAGMSWLEVLRSLFFWTMVVGMVVYVVRTYLLDHPEILRALSTFGPIRALGRFMRALWRRLLGLAQVVGERFPIRWVSSRRRDRASDEPLRLFRLSGLAARERVLYYYLSILRRAGRLGFRRRRSQTPEEYDAMLGPYLPHARQDMDALTQAFVEARYSLHPVGRDRERQTRTRWQRVKAALRRFKRG